MTNGSRDPATFTGLEGLFFSTAGAAEYLGYAAATLRSWRMRKDGPPYIQPFGKGTPAYYDKEVLDDWKGQRF